MPALNAELEERWSAWLLLRNRKGTLAALWIALGLYPLFGVLDYLVAPRQWLWLLYTTRASVLLITLGMFFVVHSRLFDRHPDVLSALFMILTALGISLMTVFMGGLSSRYYAGLSLTIVGTGLLCVWPTPVVVTTHGIIISSFIIPNLLSSQSTDLLAAVSNQFFLVSTAIIVGTGQVLAYRSQRGQVESQLMLERATSHLESAHAELKRLDRFKSEFFANVTHELKTPLTLILAPLGLLIDGHLGSVSDAQRSTFQSMQKSGVKLSRLIGDLLDLTKLEESRLRLRLDQHDLVAYLRGLVAQVQPLAERKSIELTFEADLPRADIWCDIERIERVFINLLSNATKFTDMGGAVRVRLRDEGRHVSVEVADTGIGFPSELCEDVFGRFFQADLAGTRRYGGTGIGLALAKELVELHGGRIAAESAPGQGARFRVSLRKDRDHLGPDVLDRREAASDRLGGQRASDGSLAEWQLDTPKHFRLLDIDEATDKRLVERDLDEHEREHTVLVVEDTPDVARVIRLALHHEFRILVAGDGEQGLDLARRYHPTIIVTDWMMPKMDGLQLTRHVRADPRTKHIPVVMLTARSDVADRVSGLEVGVNAYLGKPFATSELLSTVRSLLRSGEVAADSLLNQKMDSLETIAAGLAHEIKNPLNYVKNALVSVERDCASLIDAVKSIELCAPQSGTMLKLDARIQKMCEVSRAGVQRIAGTVDLMMRYSREGYSRSRRPIDAFAAVRDVVRVVVPTVGREIAVSLDLSGSGWISCVPEEFNQVLSSLIQNALEAVADESGSVIVRGYNDLADLILSVKDNGPGIPEGERARVFDAFYTTKEVGQGMGLGLTISRRVVVAMGGTLTLKSQLGLGSEFVIRVPSSLCLEAAG